MSKYYPWIAFALILIFSAILGTFGDPTVIHWRMLETIAVILGFFGLVSVVGEANRVIVSNKLAYISKRPESVMAVFDSVKGSYLAICRGRISRVQQYPMAAPVLEQYECVRDLLAGAPQTIEAELPDLETWFQDWPEEITEPELCSFKDDLSYIVQRYQESRAEVHGLRDELEQSGFEQVVSVLAPYLVAASLGIAFFSAAFKP